MLSIFLVDDEVIEMDLMQHFIDWKSLGIEVVGTAKNGKKAWEQIQALQPDIVLTDVRMPIMDGLQLASLIQSHYDWMKIVFLSGHDEFRFVKSALEAGAVGYLLKPIDRRELTAVMEKVKGEIEKVQLLRRSKQVLISKYLGELVTAADSAIREQALAELAKVAPEVVARQYVIALISGSAQPAVDQNQGSAVIQSVLKLNSQPLSEGAMLLSHELGWVVILPSAAGGAEDGLWQSLSTALMETLGEPVTIGIGGEGLGRQLHEGHDMFLEAVAAVEERFYLGHGHIIHAGEVQHSPEVDATVNVTVTVTVTVDVDVTLESDILLQKLSLSDAEGQPFLNELHSCYERLKRMRVDREQVVQISKQLLQAIHAELLKYEDRANMGVGEVNEWIQTIETRNTMDEITGYIAALLETIRQYLSTKQQDPHAALVQEVVEIIESQYGESLTIEYLAGKVYLSPNYLRVLFKEKKGCTVHEYLTKVRLTRAVELLRNRTLKIHDVAKSVGYDNTSYFCSFFYKTQGVTPNEYRKKFL
ncbi:response regulator transcription factor [Paenibacillus taihuensis]|uniref:response regulator transcription factor n=1 Tax=Paenibacillus taihuensis TaxID=1156355 RepID=UPI0011C0264B|nr:response regulator [Paenibacillus taihuensis]